MLFRQLFDHASCTYTYLLADESTKEAILIDPVLENANRDLRLLAELNLKLNYIVETHVHADHITGAARLKEQTGAQTAVSRRAGVETADLVLQTGERLLFGAHSLEARETPGHTGGCMTLVTEIQGRTVAFTGDTLFIRGCGRTDFQEGSPQELYRSVHEHIFSLPDETLIYPGHDYNGHCCSTVGEEKRLNPRLKTDHDVSAFAAIMNGLNLSYPKKIDEALPANLQGGRTE